MCAHLPLARWDVTKSLDSCEQLRAAVGDDVTHHAAVILRRAMMAPCFLCIMGGVITVSVEISMPRFDRRIVFPRIDPEIDGRWEARLRWIYKGASGNF